MRRALPVLLGLSLAACATAPAPSAAPPSSGTYAFTEEVEVRNGLSVPVNVKARRSTGGEVLIGTVRANSTQRLVLPERNVGIVYAETEAGERVPRDHHAAATAVQIRRLRPGGE